MNHRFLLTALLLSPLTPSAALLRADADPAPKRVLVVTVTTGFRHSSIPVAEAALQRMAAESGRFAVDFVRQPEGMPRPPARPRPGPAGEADPAHQAALRKFAAEEKAFNDTWNPRIEAALRALSPANLRNYDAVLFASTTGDLPIPDKQGFIDWIASGKAFIGVHAATDTFHGFRPFIDMIGGEFRTHGPQVPVEVLNDDPAHAAAAPVPARWPVFDEIYQFKSYERSKVRDLLRLDRLMLNAEDIKAGRATVGHFPVSWCRTFQKGRVFYTSLGHREDLWDAAFSDKSGRKNNAENARIFQQHLLGGILWALGLAAGDATPRTP
jgi:type 1 glutamine amidotransferase